MKNDFFNLYCERIVVIMYTVGFNNEKYLELQSARIQERIAQFGNKLYLEFGGKLFDDYHASRVLPGFEIDSKVRMLSAMADKVEIILVINSLDIEKSKIRGDVGITYDADILRLIDEFRDRGLYVGSVVIGQYAGQASADMFKAHLERLGLSVYFNHYIPEYPTNIPYILSEEGFGKNDYIETTRPLVVVTAPGPGSGKMAACMSQLYHEHIRGINAGYAKFETFPVWNLSIKNPINIAYEAATLDLDDMNMIDPFHLEAYGETTVNYNRDIEVFPVLNTIFKRIWGESPYKSPTDMGVNMAGLCISDEETCSNAAKQEIISRYYALQCDIKSGRSNIDALTKIEMLMNRAEVSLENRPVVLAALSKAKDSGTPSAAIELTNGEILTGRTTPLLGASSAILLNALKYLAGIDDKEKLLAPSLIEPIQKMKVGFLGNENPRLHTNEVLIALSICSVTDPRLNKVIEQLPKLRHCEVHSSVILSQVDINVFKKLGINVTCEPQHSGKKLYHK